MKLNHSKRVHRAIGEVARVRVEELECRTLLSVTFGSGTAYGGLHTLHTRVVDLNGDGKPDIVAIGTTADGTTPAVDFFMNQGGGVYGTAIPLPYSQGNADSVAVGDFNGDSVPDIAVADARAATVTVYLGAGSNINSPTPTFLAPVTTTFGTPVNFVSVDQMETGHFGGSDDDLVVLDPNDNNEVLVLPSTGQGHFGTPIPIQSVQNNVTRDISVENVDQFAIADFTGDGVSDIAYAEGPDIEVQFGEAGGIFSTTAFNYGPVPDTLIEQVQAGVLTSGGKPDIIVPNNTFGGANDVSIFLNNGAGSFSGPTNYSVASADFVTLGDFDDNGALDIAVTDPAVGIQLLANTGSGTFLAAQSITFPTNTQNMLAADLNADGHADLVVPDTLGLGAGTVGDIGVFLEGASSGGGGGGGGGGGSLSGTLTGTTPSSVLAGQKVKIGQTLTVTNSTGALVSGTVSGILYLSSDGTIDANSIRLGSASKKTKLKAGAHLALSLKASAIPVSTPNATYHLIAQITGPGGLTTDATSTGTITVAPAEIDLSGAFSKTPVPGKTGKTTLSFSVSDAGNTAAVGNLAFDIDNSPDGQIDDATVITPSSKKIDIKPGKPGKITLAVTLPAGTYFLMIQLDPNDAFSDVNRSNNAFATSAQVTVA